MLKHHQGIHVYAFTNAASGRVCFFKLVESLCFSCFLKNVHPIHCYCYGFRSEPLGARQRGHPAAVACRGSPPNIALRLAECARNGPSLRVAKPGPRRYPGVQWPAAKVGVVFCPASHRAGSLAATSVVVANHRCPRVRWLLCCQQQLPSRW